MNRKAVGGTDKIEGLLGLCVQNFRRIVAIANS
jgi:hypothetical protein